MTTLRGIAQLSDCLLTHMLLAYWRKLLACSMITFPRARARFLVVNVSICPASVPH
jgi:hypothetical protein